MQQESAPVRSGNLDVTTQHRRRQRHLYTRVEGHPFPGEARIRYHGNTQVQVTTPVRPLRTLTGNANARTFIDTRGNLHFKDTCHSLVRLREGHCNVRLDIVSWCRTLPP